MSSSFSDEQPLLKINMDADGATIRTLYTGKIFTLYQVRIRSRFYVRKQLSVEFKDAELYKNLLRKEFEIGQQLDHPNIVRYVFITDDESGLYVFMDYLKGDTLHSLLANEDKVLNEPTVFIRTLVANLSSAFSYLHDKGIFHGDVSPSNIVYNKELKRFFLIDLGFAVTDNYIKLGGGTESFAAPEAFANPSKINATSDIFSFGKVVALIVAAKGINKYRAILDKCCATEQSNRYQDFAEVANAFRQTETKKLWLLALAVPVTLIAGSLLFYKLRTLNTTTKAMVTAPKPAIAPPPNKEKSTLFSIDRINKPVINQGLNKKGATELLNVELIPQKQFEVQPTIAIRNSIDSNDGIEPRLKNEIPPILPKHNDGYRSVQTVNHKNLVKVPHDAVWAYKIAEDKSYVKLYRLLVTDTMKAKTLNAVMNKCINQAFEDYKKFVNENNFDANDKSLLMNAYYGRQRPDFLEIEREIHKKYLDEASENSKK